MKVLRESPEKRVPSKVVVIESAVGIARMPSKIAVPIPLP